MPRPDAERPNGGGPGRLAAGAVAVALLAGAWLIHDGTSVSGPPRPPAHASDAVASSSPTSSAPAVAPLPASVPMRLRIPTLKVDAPITGVGLDGQQHIAAPPMSDRNLVGWYRDGVSPGAKGDAIAVGHVDNHTGPAVFYRLSLVHRGVTIEVVRSDHRTAVFTVDEVRTYRKNAFPNDTVYGQTARPELHLITCGGHFDHRSGYDSNVVVFSHLTAVR